MVSLVQVRGILNVDMTQGLNWEKCKATFLEMNFSFGSWTYTPRGRITSWHWLLQDSHKSLHLCQDGECEERKKREWKVKGQEGTNSFLRSTLRMFGLLIDLLRMHFVFFFFFLRVWHRHIFSVSRNQFIFLVSLSLS